MSGREERIEELYQESARWLASRIVDLEDELATTAATPDRVWLDAEEVRVVVQALACL